MVFIIGLTASFFAQANTAGGDTWESKLFEKDVDYGSFACLESDRKNVNAFFSHNPLHRVLGSSMCHNNCAVLGYLIQRPLPAFSRKTIGQGFIAVHVLVNKRGKPIYARAVNGSPIMRSTLQKRSCEALFHSSSSKRQTVIYFCTTGDCNEAQPVENQ